MDTLRILIVEILNELNYQLRATDDGQEKKEIRRLKKILWMLLEDVIEQELDKNSQTYKDAIEALERADKDAKRATLDIKKCSESLNSIVDAIKILEKVVGTTIGIFT